jgi:multiple sugar transport system permease protein
MVRFLAFSWTSFAVIAGLVIALAAVLFWYYYNYLFKPKDDEGNDITEIEFERRQGKKRKIISRVITYVFLTIVAVFSFLPFYWMVMSSVKTEMEYRQSVPTFFPHTFQFRNYAMVIGAKNNMFGQALVNTLVIGFVSTTLGVIVTILTAYALARMNFAGKELLFTLMLGTMMIPGEMFTITNYLTVNQLHWKDTYTVMIVPFLISIYYIYLLRNNFKQIPNSLYQAAKVDGLSDMGYLLKVMIPLTAPTLISVTLLKFIGTWNSYIWPRLVNSESWRLITNWVTNGFTDFDSSLYAGKYGTSDPLETLKMAATCMVSAPLFILFVLFRKYIMHGVSRSGTKG